VASLLEIGTGFHPDLTGRDNVYLNGAILGMSVTMVPGIVIGVVGLVMALVNYPLHQKLLGSRKKKYADEILKLSDKIINK
jgi:hypothetical protein